MLGFYTPHLTEVLRMVFCSWQTCHVNKCVVHCMLKLTILGSECFHADHLHCAVWIICCEEKFNYLYLALSMIQMIK
jgi:hypothetical protein